MPWELCLPPSVTGEVYCFHRCQLIFSFGGRVIYHLKGLRVHSEIDPVCTTIFKRIAGLHLHHKSLIMYGDAYNDRQLTLNSPRNEIPQASSISVLH